MNITQDIAKALPHNEIAERAIIGAMLANNKYINEVFSELSSEDFFKDAHQKISAAIIQLSDKNNEADIITVSDFLEKQKDLKFAGGHSYISSLANDVPENLNISEYIKIVKDCSALRTLIKTSMGIIQKGVDHQAEVGSILDELQEDIIKISDKRVGGGFASSKDLIQPTMELIERIQKHGDSEGLKSNFYELDAMTSGFQKGDLIVIAARPSMGKTALALNIASNIAIKLEKTVGFFSIEMSKNQIMMRLLSSQAPVDMSAIRTGKPHFTQKEWSNLERASTELNQARLFIDDSASLSIIEMKTRARRLKMEHGLDIIFVDYLQLMKVTGDQLRKNDTRAQEVSIITASLKEIAKELQIPVVALAQLNRAPEQRGIRKEGGSKYQLSDLKESGSIEQDADVVMFLHREEQVNRETDRTGEADLIVAKQRNGPTGKIILAFIDKYTKFANYEFSQGN